MDPAAVIGLAVATLGGLAIGLERQRSGHASGPQAHFGGIRTFTLLGATAGASGWLAVNGLLPLATVLLTAAAALVVAAYVAASRVDIDGTTEVAAIVVLVAGTLAGSGRLTLASAIIAATAVLLLEKTRLHHLATRLDDRALRASARFAALAAIILPLLPPGPFGPLGAVRPRELWMLVLFFSGLSFAGWLARRVVGPHHGVIVSGLLGGIISSTSVTLSFARESRASGAPRIALAAGAIGACTVMLARVLVACAVLNPTLAALLPRYMAAPFVLGAIGVAAAWRANGSTSRTKDELDSPLSLKAALQMAGLFQLVLLAILVVQARWGSGALVATSAFIGLTDLDALTLSLARGTPSSAVGFTTVAALTAGILSNTLLKLTVAVVVGRGWFRGITATGLGAMAVAIVASLWAGR
jgi:uncharacterized membrane protein (DUF4010 family)